MLSRTEAARLWDERVAAEREQSVRVNEGTERTDAWQGNTARFRPPPEDAPKDPVVTAVARYLSDSSTLIDVGAGGGRLAVPLSAYCDRLIAVEPSEAMNAVLTSSIEERHIENMEVVAATWEDAAVDRCDVVLSSHVLYFAAPIRPFVEKMIDRASERVIVLLAERQPQAPFYPVWPLVHAEERVPLPAFSELVILLDSWGIDHEVREVTTVETANFTTREAALESSVSRLRLEPGSEKAKRLERMLSEVLVETEDGGFEFQWARPNPVSLVTWTTA